MPFDPSMVHRIGQGAGYKSRVLRQSSCRNPGETERHGVGVLLADRLDRGWVGEIGKFLIGQASV